MTEHITKFQRLDQPAAEAAIEACLDRMGLAVETKFVKDFAAFTGVYLGNEYFLYPTGADGDGEDVSEFVDWTDPDELEAAMEKWDPSGEGDGSDKFPSAGMRIPFALGAGGNRLLVDISNGAIWVDRGGDAGSAPQWELLESSFQRFVSKLVKYA